MTTSLVSEVHYSSQITNLVVHELSDTLDIRNKIATTLDKWILESNQKRDKLEEKIRKDNQVLNNLEIVKLKKDMQIFGDLMEIALLMKNDIVCPHPPGTSVLACERDVDDSHELQAIALVCDKTLSRELLLLVTNPHNVRSSVNQDQAHRVEGAARAIIYYLAATLTYNYECITADVLPSAIPFYRKLGFEFDCGSDPNSAHMRLTADKISELFEI